jgi:tRNA modification GTPase
VNKVDLLDPKPSALSKPDRFLISAATGAGVEELVAAMVQFAGEAFGRSEPALVTRERQREKLGEVSAALRDAMGRVGQGEELLAEDLRHALAGLGRLTGRLDVEEVLDVIFREFCVGK